MNDRARQVEPVLGKIARPPGERSSSWPPSGAEIELRGVTKRYGDTIAVDNVTLAIRSGEFLTLLGASGSGKTTLLGAISGFVTIDEGSVTLGEADVTRLPPHRRNVGMVFQHYALFPHLTVSENIAYPLKVRRRPTREIQDRVEEVLSTVQLSGLGDRFPKQLSGGQQQRVALARALVYNPPVLLMDEPLGALDRRLREDLQTEITNLHRTYGITFVYVTHDQEEALVMSDRIAVIREGQLAQVDTPQELYERPESRFVAEFVGRSNVFTGRVSSDGSTFQHDAGQAVRLGTVRPAADRLRQALVVRPERIRFADSSDESIPPAANRWPASIQQVAYLGSTQRLTVQLDSGPTVVVEMRESPVSISDERGVVWWLPNDAVLVRDDGQLDTPEEEVWSSTGN